MHAAAGCSFYAVARLTTGTNGTYVVCDDHNQNAGQHGFSVGLVTTTNSSTVRVGNGSGTFVVNQSHSSPVTLNGATVIVQFCWSQAGGYNLSVNGSTPTTGAIVGTPSTNDAQSGLTIGSLQGGTSAFEGHIMYAQCSVGFLSADERLAVRQALATRFGVTLV